MASIVVNKAGTEGVRWTASPELVEKELTRIKKVGFFEYEEHHVDDGRLIVVGHLSRRRRYGGTESLRVRLEYPSDFPDTEPKVIDQDKVFKPSAAGHQFSDYSLCLQFPLRGEFSTDAEVLISEVLGAAWNWMVKRNIFERNGQRGWPGTAEEHGYAGPYRTLAVERAAASREIFLEVWVEWAISTRSYPRLGETCPCLSGRKLGKCHSDLAELVAGAIYYTIQEAHLNGRR
jgi:SEC-C motif